MPDTAHTPSEPQRLRALEQANAIRLARAELKRQIAEGDACVADVIIGCPEAARKWTISELLMAQRRWGITRCRKFLERNGISEMKAIGALTERQRRLLAEQLREPGGLPESSADAAERSVERPLEDRAEAGERHLAYV